MNDNFYKQIIEELPTGYAYTKIICSKDGTPCDFEFLEANSAFEKLTGLKVSDILGKRVTEAMTNINEMSFNWIDLYGDVAINGVEKEFEHFFESSQRWYKIKVYSPKKYYCITYLNEITSEMIQLSEMERLIQISEDLLHIHEEKTGYEKITNEFLKISGAKYATFNLYEEDGISFTTRVLTTDKNIEKKMADILGFSISQKKWEYTPELIEKIKPRTITRFNSLSELVGTDIPKYKMDIVEKKLNIGEVVLIKISKNNVSVGDFTLLMDKGKRFEKDTLAEVYVRQLGMLITRKKAEVALLQEKTLTDAIFHSVPGMIYLYDDENKLVRWNQKHEDMTGYSSEELVKMTLLDWYKGDKQSQKSILEGVARTMEVGFGDAEAELQKKDGSKVPMYFTASPLYLEGKHYFVGIAIDITERKKKEEEIYYLSYHDQLTGLYNRRFYEEELKRLDTERNLPLTVVMGDVNGLKLINDSFGHVMGDMLLKKVAEVLRKGCREDDVIARLAGDEFVIILPKTDAIEAEKIIKRISNISLSEKVGSVDISISFGYGTKYKKEEEMEEIFKNAENRMYEKKLFDSQSMRGKTINAIINELHNKNKNEEQHSYRLSVLCKKIGEVLGLLESEIKELVSVALLHDIGKIVVDQNILNKPGKLTDDEWKEIKRHPETGYRMVNTVNEMSTMATYILYHHERWDGKGYPKGLKGKDIPFVSRIIGVLDAYVAMTSYRSYRNALSMDEAIEELQKNAATQFDPDLVKIFIEKVLIPARSKM